MCLVPFLTIARVAVVSDALGSAVDRDVFVGGRRVKWPHPCKIILIGQITESFAVRLWSLPQIADGLALPGGQCGPETEREAPGETAFHLP